MSAYSGGHELRPSPTRGFVHRHDEKTTRDFAPSFYEAGYLSDEHTAIVGSLKSVRGKLEPADHLKLYEAGWFAQGTIVEIGPLAAKSTICLALGARGAQNKCPIYSIEYSNKYVATAAENLQRFAVFDRVTLIQGDSAIQVKRIPAPFDTVFVDGDHTYDGVRRDIEALEGLIAPGGLLMFHDYYHSANKSGEYGVRRAVDQAVPALRLSFRGRFGGIALFEVD